MSERDFIGRAWDASLPVLVVGEVMDRDFAAEMAILDPDLVLVACFTRRLPAAVLRVPRWGCLNLHPSLLPAYRGPSPLFWQFRDGLSDIGVTAHWMDEHLDTGDIAAQRPIALPEGCSEAEADRIWAAAGAELALEIVADLKRDRRPRRPQPSGGSYQGAPKAEDFTLSVEWPARRAFIFMRGTEAWGRPYSVTIGERTYSARAAIRYQADALLPEPVIVDGSDLLVQFSPGVVRVRV
jgi:methionyl-tRNA formyltransferase